MGKIKILFEEGETNDFSVGQFVNKHSRPFQTVFRQLVVKGWFEFQGMSFEKVLLSSLPEALQVGTRQGRDFPEQIAN